MYDEMLFSVSADKATPVERIDLFDVGLKERQHLQEWILANPDVLGSKTEIIASEYDRFQTAGGDPVHDRLDILAIDEDGRIVVVELKRGTAPHTVHMQAINYAAMVSRFTPDDIADLYVAARQGRGETVSADAALTKLTTERLMAAESIRHPRIVLIASDFPPPVTSAVVWLNEQGVDIALIRYRCYRLGDGQLVVSFSKLFPVPDVEEFTIGRSSSDGALIDDEPEVPWDEESLRRLAGQANPATLAVLDLCAAEEATTVTVKDVAKDAGITEAAVRGQLAGLTMRLRNPKYGFAQTSWPFSFEWQGDHTTYSMDHELARIWRTIQKEPQSGFVSKEVLQDSAGLNA
jgi:hypothetical protein